jgi:hypothetical protein
VRPGVPADGVLMALAITLTPISPGTFTSQAQSVQPSFRHDASPDWSMTILQFLFVFWQPQLMETPFPPPLPAPIWRSITLLPRFTNS